MARAIEARRAERERLISSARRYVGLIGRRVELVAAAVVGSVARGDFNVWSDVDVVVVSSELPEPGPDRGALLVQDAPAGVQPVGFSPEEFETAWRRRNPMVREATAAGVILIGEEFLRRPRSDRSMPQSLQPGRTRPDS